MNIDYLKLCGFLKGHFAEVGRGLPPEEHGDVNALQKSRKLNSAVILLLFLVLLSVVTLPAYANVASDEALDACFTRIEQELEGSVSVRHNAFNKTINQEKDFLITIKSVYQEQNVSIQIVTHCSVSQHGHLEFSQIKKVPNRFLVVSNVSSL